MCILIIFGIVFAVVCGVFAFVICITNSNKLAFTIAAAVCLVLSFALLFVGSFSCCDCPWSVVVREESAFMHQCGGALDVKDECECDNYSKDKNTSGIIEDEYRIIEHNGETLIIDKDNNVFVVEHN